MPLPIVSGSEQISTPIGGAKIDRLDSNAFRKAALAPGRLAEAIGQDVGGVFDEVSQKIQANRNARQVFQADLAMRKTKDNFTAQLAKMPDEGTWLPAWKQQVDQQRETIQNNPHVGPDVRRVLDQKFDIWEAATTSEIRTQALRKGVADTREDAIADSTYAAHQGDIEGAQNILKAAVSHYAMDAADANRIGKRFPTIAAQAQADTAISTNPIKAPDLIKQFEGVMEPRMYVALQVRAREAQNQARASNLNDFAEQMDNSPDGTIDPKQLQSAVKSGNITQRGADQLNARMEKKNIEHAKDEFSVGLMNAQDHNWTDDKTPQDTAREMKEDGASLPPALRIRLYNHIDKLSNDAAKLGSKEEKPVEAQVLSQMREDREKQGLFFPSAPLKGVDTQYQHLQGGLKALDKMKDEDAKDLYGMPKDKIMEAEKLHYAQMQGKMRDWFEANPKAKIDEANEYRMQLEQPFVHEAAKSALSGQQNASELNKLLKKYGQ